MKPSDVKRRSPADRDKPKPYKVSAKANPPISSAEVERAGVAICPWHNGLIRATGAPDGSVHLCPLGGMYWRYKKPGKGGGALPLPTIRLIRVDKRVL